MSITHRPCECGSGLYPSALLDGHGIFLTFACERCRKEKLSHFRPDIMSRYGCDEPIEPDEPEECYVTSQADFRQPKEDRD